MDKHVVFVIGPAFVGKSHYIKENFPDYHVVDLFDFQNWGMFATVEDVLKSYNDCETALRDALRNHNKIVLEHTLIKAKRRPQYIKAVQEEWGVNPDVVYLTTTEETLNNHVIKRTGKPAFQGDYRGLAMFDIPTVEEGFNEVKKVKVSD